MEERPGDRPAEDERDPTVDADRAEPTAPGPGDSEGARPEPPGDDDGGGDAAGRAGERPAG